MKRMLTIAALAMCAGLVQGADYALNWRTDTGTSPTNALEWFSPDTWSGQTPPNAADAIVWATNKTSGIYYVHADQPVTVGRLSGKSLRDNITTSSELQAVFISDHPLTVTRAANAALQWFLIYADLVVPTAYASTYYNSFIACGDMNEGANMAFNTAFTHRMDLYANAASEVRENASITYLMQSYGPVTWVAPQSSPVAVVGQWSQTAGSKYLVRTGAAHALCAGTLVHGTGIPEGAFLKRIFGNHTIEISQAATETVEGNSVTFDAFSPKVYQYVATLGRGATSAGDFLALKCRAEDEFTMEVGSLSVVAGRAARFTTTAGYAPARWLLHDTSSVAGKITLADCHLELDALRNGNANNVGFPNACVQQDSATAVSRLTVTNSLVARIIGITNLVGTVVKDGAGTLRTTLSRATARNTGKLVVAQGTLELTGVDEHYVKTLAVSNGATLKLAAGGTLRVVNLQVEPGARLEGGTVLMPSYAASTAALAAGLVCAEGGRLSFPGTTEQVLWEPAATNVPGNPALWFDLSREETISAETAAYDGKERITRLNDVRGAGYMFATNTTSVQGPELIRDANGNPRLYHAERIRNAKTNGNGERYLDKQHALIWSARLSNIRSIFKVTCQPGSDQQYLGVSWSSSPGWLRPAGWEWDRPLFYNNTVRGYPAISNAEFRVNGFVRKWSTGFAYPGGKLGMQNPRDWTPQVTEFHLASGPVPQADNCGDFTGGGDDQYPRAGMQLYEILIYTNDLTQAEKLQIRGYLMKKWLNAEAEYALDAADPGNGGAVDVGADGRDFDVASGNFRLATVTGTGAVAKHGAGTMYLEDHVRVAGALKVAEGKMVLRSETPTVDTLPEGAYLHVDASDATTYDLNANGRVETWRDRRGADHPTMTRIGTSTSADSQPLPIADALNGLTMIRLPPNENGHGITAGSSAFSFPACTDAHSVFSVLATTTWSAGKRTGGVLLGSNAITNFIAGGVQRGIWRIGGGCYDNTIVANSDPIVAGSEYTAVGTTLGYYGIGATRTRLDGVVTNFNVAHYKYDGAGDMASLVTYGDIWTDALGQNWTSDGAVYWGAQDLGETIVYREALAASTVDRVEAYLSKKWFDRETVGHRAATAGTLEVAAGAELEIVGNAPVTVGALTGGGTVDGDVAFAADAELVVPIVGGAIAPLMLTGDLTGAATVRVTGDPATLAVGVYTILTAASVPAGTWTVSFDTPDVHRRRYRVRQTATALQLEVAPRGTAINFR